MLPSLTLHRIPELTKVITATRESSQSAHQFISEMSLIPKINVKQSPRAVPNTNPSSLHLPYPFTLIIVKPHKEPATHPSYIKEQVVHPTSRPVIHPIFTNSQWSNIILPYLVLTLKPVQISRSVMNTFHSSSPKKPTATAQLNSTPSVPAAITLNSRPQTLHRETTSPLSTTPYSWGKNQEVFQTN